MFKLRGGEADYSPSLAKMMYMKYNKDNIIALVLVSTQEHGTGNRC